MTRYYSVIAKKSTGESVPYRNVTTPYRLAEYLQKNGFVYAIYYNKADRSRAGHWNRQDGLKLT